MHLQLNLAQEKQVILPPTRSIYQFQFHLLLM